MHKILARVGVVAAAVSVFPGCLEYALVKALEEDNDDVVEVGDGYDTTDVYTDDSYAEDEYYDDSYADDTYYDDGTQGPLDIRSASLAGDMGEIRGFADDTPTTVGYDYGSYLSVEVHAQAPSGAAMGILQVEGGLDNAELVDGAHLRFANYEYSSSGLYMYLIGCSGPQEGNWMFDESAGDLVVDVSVTPEGTTVLDFAATFDSGQQVVGSTELGPLQAQ